jgi:5-carboxymethyl-2-hydroxymuconate isomerase
MPRLIFEYTKSVLERVSFDAKLFCKELNKALKTLLPFEIQELKNWLLIFTKEKPELRRVLIDVKL